MRTHFWPGCGGLSCGLGVGPAGQLAVPIGQTFPLAYMPFIWVGSLFADPVLSCCGGFQALASECSVWRWFLCGVAGERGIWECQFFRLQAAFPSSCGVKCTHQAVSLTAVDGRRRWVIFFQGMPLGAWVALLPQIKCLCAVKYSLGERTI